LWNSLSFLYPFHILSPSLLSSLNRELHRIFIFHMAHFRTYGHSCHLWKYVKTTSARERCNIHNRRHCSRRDSAFTITAGRPWNSGLIPSIGRGSSVLHAIYTATAHPASYSAETGANSEASKRDNGDSSPFATEIKNKLREAFTSCVFTTSCLMKNSNDNGQTPVVQGPLSTVYSAYFPPQI
jgi:hypothetical protein